MGEEKMKTCPRCKKRTLHPNPEKNVLSLKDNKTYICPACGEEEANKRLPKALEKLRKEFLSR
jgi:RNA polymerase subunit RPABC4/transcription elongation factor Spt4